jgi:hypothetical protein
MLKEVHENCAKAQEMKRKLKSYVPFEYPHTLTAPSHSPLARSLSPLPLALALTLSLTLTLTRTRCLL